MSIQVVYGMATDIFVIEKPERTKKRTKKKKVAKPKK